MEKNKFEFLTSTRFIALVLGAVAFYLKSKGIIGEPEMILINTIVVGFIGVKTIDRNLGDKKVEAATLSGKTTTVTMPENVNKVTATTTPTDTTGTVTGTFNG